VTAADLLAIVAQYVIGPGLGVTAAVLGRSARKTAVEAKQSAKTVEHELTPNGGDSLRDAVNKIAEDVGKLTEKVDALDELSVRNAQRLEENSGRLAALEAKPRIALFGRGR